MKACYNYKGDGYCNTDSVSYSFRSVFLVNYVEERPFWPIQTPRKGKGTTFQKLHVLGQMIVCGIELVGYVVKLGKGVSEWSFWCF